MSQHIAKSDSDAMVELVRELALVAPAAGASAATASAKPLRSPAHARAAYDLLRGCNRFSATDVMFLSMHCAISLGAQVLSFLTLVCRSALAAGGA